MPEMTDHGPRHIENVLDNAERLLGDKINNLSGIELYCLAMSILFHDVGNIYGRENHNKKILDIYHFVRGNDETIAQERFIITKIAEAHCGKDKNGFTDTLGDVIPSYHLNGYEVKMQELSAILRLADELAEGIHRTSLFWGLIDPTHYGKESTIFHKYARCISPPHIDTGNNRISISFNIDIKEVDEKSFCDLLSFMYMRIAKLDEERKYCKFYTDLLVNYKYINVQFNFTYDGIFLDIGLSNISIDDKQTPGEFKKKIEQIDKSYEVKTLWEVLSKKSEELKNE